MQQNVLPQLRQRSGGSRGTPSASSRISSTAFMSPKVKTTRPLKAGKTSAKDWLAINPKNSYIAALVASVATCVFVFSSSQAVLDSLKFGLLREPKRLFEAIVDLADDILESYSLPSLLLNIVLVSSAAWLVIKGYTAARRVLKESNARRKAKREGYHSHATNFSHQQNAEMTASYGSLAELFLIVTARYFLEPSNVITLAIILLQGYGSSWTKHKPNAAMLGSFYFLTLISETLGYFSQSKADKEVNDQKYLASCVGTTVSYQSGQNNAGFTLVKAESLGLGNIVVVMPGQRVPIEGYALPFPLPSPGAEQPASTTAGPAQPVAPFSYAVTGENTVADPPFIPLPVGFNSIKSVECKLVDPVTLVATPPVQPVLPTGAAADAGQGTVPSSAAATIENANSVPAAPLQMQSSHRHGDGGIFSHGALTKAPAFAYSKAQKEKQAKPAVKTSARGRGMTAFATLSHAGNQGKRDKGHEDNRVAMSRSMIVSPLPPAQSPTLLHSKSADGGNGNENNDGGEGLKTGRSRPRASSDLGLPARNSGRTGRKADPTESSDAKSAASSPLYTRGRGWLQTIVRKMSLIPPPPKGLLPHHRSSIDLGSGGAALAEVASADEAGASQDSTAVASSADESFLLSPPAGNNRSRSLVIPRTHVRPSPSSSPPPADAELLLPASSIGVRSSPPPILPSSSFSAVVSNEEGLDALLAKSGFRNVPSSAAGLSRRSSSLESAGLVNKAARELTHAADEGEEDATSEAAKAVDGDEEDEEWLLLDSEVAKATSRATSVRGGDSRPASAASSASSSASSLCIVEPSPKEAPAGSAPAALEPVLEAEERTESAPTQTLPAHEPPAESPSALSSASSSSSAVDSRQPQPHQQQAAVAATLQQLCFAYFINGQPIPSHCDRVPRGAIHAPRKPGLSSGAGSGEGAEALQPLFILAGLPRRFEADNSEGDNSSGGGPMRPLESQWLWTVKRVMAVQVVVLVLFSLQSWASGQSMRRSAAIAAAEAAGQDTSDGTILGKAAGATLSSFIAFVLGTAVMGNTLLPLRESLVNSIFLSICKALLPGVKVKPGSENVLETARSVANVISDKTGTLTSEKMTYRWPISAGIMVGPTTDISGTGLSDAQEGSPQDLSHNSEAQEEGVRGGDPWGLGPALLLATNDSTPNPLHHISANGDTIDTRLASTPALCTTSEEGAIFHALTTPFEERSRKRKRGTRLSSGSSSRVEERVDERRHFTLLALREAPAASSLPSVFILKDCQNKGRLLRAVVHYRGPFLPNLVARLSVATFWELADARGSEEEASVVTAACDLTLTGHQLYSQGWRPLTPPLLIVQGGGDAVAKECGVEAALFERERLLEDPSRTLAHAVAIFAYPKQCFSAPSSAASPVDDETCRSQYEEDKRLCHLRGISQGMFTLLCSPSASRFLALSQETVVKAHASAARAAKKADTMDAAAAAATTAATVMAASGLMSSSASSLLVTTSMMIPSLPSLSASLSIHGPNRSRSGSFVGFPTSGSGAVASQPTSTSDHRRHLQRLFSGALCLTHLSKFGNKIVPGAEFLFQELLGQGVKLHLCSGDTLLTLRSVAKDMRIVLDQQGSDTPTAPHTVPAVAPALEVIWDESVTKSMAATLEALAAEQEAKKALLASPTESVSEEAAEDHQEGEAVQGSLFSPEIDAGQDEAVALPAAAVAAPGLSLDPRSVSFAELAARLEAQAAQLRRLTKEQPSTSGGLPDAATAATGIVSGASSAAATPVLTATGAPSVGGLGELPPPALGSPAVALMSPIEAVLQAAETFVDPHHHHHQHGRHNVGHPAQMRVVVFCCAEVLKLLHRYRSFPAVLALTTHPRITFALYRIKASQKPLAVDLFSEAEAWASGLLKDEDDDEELQEGGLGAKVESVKGAGALSLPGVGAGPGGRAIVDRSIFCGDGPNDAPALASTQHSAAMQQGSILARNASNLILVSSVALPEMVTLARLFHGGRAVVLRDVVFVGTCIVMLLSVAAHISGFEPLAAPSRSSSSKASSSLVVFEDPWSPLLMLGFTMAVHSPRMIVQALAEGLNTSFHDHRDMLFKVAAEVVMAILSSLWVGVILKTQVTDPGNYVQQAALAIMERQMQRGAAGGAATIPNTDAVVAAAERSASVGLQSYAPLALASLVLLSFLRQNLVIASTVFGQLKVLPPRAKGMLVAESKAMKKGRSAEEAEADEESDGELSNDSRPEQPSPGAVAASASRGSDFKQLLLWLYQGLPGQILVFTAYLFFVSRKRLPMSICLVVVLKAVAGPALLMAVGRLLFWLSELPATRATFLPATDTTSASVSSSTNAGKSKRGRV